MSLLIILAAVMVFLVALEVGLRLLFGFGSPLVYMPDEQIGYLLTPNQRTRRFGNRIEINEYSMRSASTTKMRSPSTFRVLLIGDSVANGGWWTDQTQTIAAMMTQTLTQTLPAASNDMRSREDADHSPHLPISPSPHLPLPSSRDPQRLSQLLGTTE